MVQEDLRGRDVLLSHGSEKPGKTFAIPGRLVRGEQEKPLSVLIYWMIVTEEL
ncbi:hypothetical protein GCM10027052_10450 [Parafrigoribacterium mesophilum]